MSHHNIPMLSIPGNGYLPEEMTHSGIGFKRLIHTLPALCSFWLHMYYNRQIKVKSERLKSTSKETCKVFSMCILKVKAVVESTP